MITISDEMAKALASPFSDDDVKWKPQVTTKGKEKQDIIKNGQRVAGCTAHIDARAVMNRLDEVVGVGNWSDSYRVLGNGKNVECTLTVCGVSKSDVGEPNEGGFADLMKGAYSDALKRAAVKFGIGRYLYDMDMEWLPYDGYKIIQQPKKAQPRPAQKNGNIRPPAPPPMPENELDAALGTKPPSRPLNIPERMAPSEIPMTARDDHEQHISPGDSAIADIRASLEEYPRMTGIQVADALVSAGLYNSRDHVESALKKEHDGFKKSGGKLSAGVDRVVALEWFDFLAARKADAA